MSNKKKIFFLPEDISSVISLVCSEDFKKYIEANSPTKAEQEALTLLQKSKTEEEVSMLLLSEHRAGQNIITKYLKSITKPEKRPRYSFLLAYQGFTKNQK